MALRTSLRSRSEWLTTLGPIVVVLFIAGFALYYRFEWPSLATDPAFFQHTGWYVLQGGVPYIDVWDVNPPVPFAITAVLSALSGGNMLVLYGLSSALTSLVAAASVVFVAWIAYLVTEENAAAVAAGLTMLVVPELYVLPLQGVRAQFYALFFGTASLALVLRDRPFLAGAVAALSAGSWQSGAVFAFLIVGMAYQRRGRNGALSAVAGGGVVTGIVVLVFAAAGALVPMVVQTILAPLVAGSPHSWAEHIYTVLLVFGYGSVLLPVAFYGWAHAAVCDPRVRWWVPVGGAILAFQVLYIDMDGSTDAVLWLSFVALGVAITVERVIAWQSTRTEMDHADPDVTRTARHRWIVVAVIGVLILSGLAWNIGSPAPKSTLQTMEQEATPGGSVPITPDDADVPSMQTIYWEQLQPDTCHYRLSWNEVRWISMTDDRLDAQTCDGWPDRINRS